ncbi:MAG: PilZ domain-containing protein [Desulfobacterales bacterium]|nr:PilZ domain-containing protein [Desulfobacterales bacterium]
MASSDVSDNSSNSKKGTVKDRLIALIDKMSEYHQLSLLKLLEKSQLKIRRKHKRVMSKVSVDCFTEGLAPWDSITNISKAGAYIETLRHLSIAQSIKITFSFPDRKKINIDGVVVRMDQEGIGVKFTQEIDDKTITDIMKNQ